MNSLKKSENMTMSRFLKGIAKNLRYAVQGGNCFKCLEIACK